MIHNILGSFAIEEPNSKIDSIKKELEDLVELSPNERSRNYISEKARDFNQAVINAINNTNTTSEERYNRARNILHDIISEIQEHFEKNPLTQRICEVLKSYSNFLVVASKLEDIKRMFEKVYQVEDSSEIVPVLSNAYKLCTDFVNEFWDTPEFSSRIFMISSAVMALDFLSINYLQEFEPKTADGNDLIADFKEILKKFVKSVLIAQKREIDTLRSQKDPYYSLGTPRSEKAAESFIALMKSWQTKYDPEEMHESLESFKKGIDEDRGSGRKLFS
jgi:uncharacterized protein YutD